MQAEDRTPAPNRVTPTGEIVAIAQRGLFLGNRGCLHRRPREIARPWQVRRWITCALSYKGWVAPRWEPRRWTPLFFWDEAVALAAGHRPCALCRRRDYEAWMAAWRAAFGARPGADDLDRVLHADRLDGRAQRRHAVPWPDVPPGAFAALPRDQAGDGARTAGSAPDDGGVTGAATAGDGGRTAGSAPGVGDVTGAATARDGARTAGGGVGEHVPVLVLADRLVPWSAGGYGEPVDRPTGGGAAVLTPAATVEVLRHGYEPVVHPSAQP